MDRKKLQYLRMEVFANDEDDTVAQEAILATSETPSKMKTLHRGRTTVLERPDDDAVMSDGEEEVQDE